MPTSNTKSRQIFFVAVAIFSLIQIILVFIVDCAAIALISKYEKAEDFLNGPGVNIAFTKSIFALYATDKETMLLGWSIGHLVLHTEWMVSSFLLLAFAMKPEPRRSYQVMQFALSTVIICLCDLGAGIHASVLVSNVNWGDQGGVGPFLFFPLFFTKLGLIWICNIIAAILMLNVLSHIHKAHRQAASREKLAHTVVTNPESDWRADIQTAAPLPRLKPPLDNPHPLKIEQPPSHAAYNDEYVPTRLMGPPDQLEEYVQLGNSSRSGQTSHSTTPQLYHQEY